MSADSEFSYTKGMTFIFHDGDRRIRAFYSSFDGKEQVFVNEELVVEKRQLTSLKSESTFEAGGHRYAVRLETESLTKGPIICTLAKDGQALQRKKVLIPEAATKLSKTVIIAVVVGAVVGLVAKNVRLSWSMWLLLAVAVFVVVFVVQLAVRLRRKPTIVDDNIYPPPPPGT